MAKNGGRKKNEKDYPKEKKSGLKTQTKHGIMAVVFFVFAIFFLMSYFNVAGKAGVFIYEKLHFLLGIGYILLPALLVLLGSSFLKSEALNIGWRSVISGTMFLLSGLGIIDIVSGNHAGGLFGEILSTPFVSLFDSYASIIFLGAILIISILVIFDAKLDLGPFFRKFWQFITRKKSLDDIRDNFAQNSTELEVEEPALEEEEEVASPATRREGGKEKEEEEEDMPIKKRRGGPLSTYVPPPLSLLEEDQGKPNTGDIKANANIIKRTLLNFGIEVEMDEITVGPTVTRYALKPAEGMKLSRILGLQNDLALALAAHPIRIEAPIPGKSLVGIEIPNRTKSLVGLGNLLGEEPFAKGVVPLLIPLGRNVIGDPIFTNIAK